MNLGKFKILISIVSIVLAISGCSIGTDTGASGEKVAMTSPPKNFLDEWNSQKALAGKAAFENLEYSRDKFTKVESWYIPENEQTLLVLNKYRFSFSLHKADDSGEYSMELNITYWGDEWQFMDSIAMRFGEDVVEMTPSFSPYRNVESDGTVGEILSFTISKKEIIFLSSIFDSKALEIRINGKTTNDISLDPGDIAILKRMLLAYRYLVNQNLQYSS